MPMTTLLLGFALLAGAPQAAPAPGALGCQLASTRVETAIARKVKALKGVEYCQFRKYEAMSDLDGDGHEDLVVSFNVEPESGENDHNGYLAVFLSSDPADTEPPIVRTGGRGERDVESIQVQGRSIILETLEYLPKDPMCCPSGHGSVTYELAGRQLKPVAPPPKKKKKGG